MLYLLLGNAGREPATRLKICFIPEEGLYSVASLALGLSCFAFRQHAGLCVRSVPCVTACWTCNLPVLSIILGQAASHTWRHQCIVYRVTSGSGVRDSGVALGHWGGALLALGGGVNVKTAIHSHFWNFLRRT